MKRVRVALSVTAALAVAGWVAHKAAAYAADAYSTEVARTAHFRFISPRSDAALARRVAAVLEPEYSRITGVLGEPLRNVVDVRITSSRLIYNLSCGIPLPTPPGDGYDGAAGERGVTILLPSGWQLGAEKDIPDRGRQLVTHEIAHVLVVQMNPAILQKRWLNEGVVWYLALGMDTPAMRRADDSWMAEDLERGRVPRMAEIAGNDQRNWQARKGDLYSRRFIQFLAERYGADKLAALIRNASDLRVVLGKDEAELFPEWLDYLNARRTNT